VVPGDTLLFKVEISEPITHGIGSMQGYAFVGENCVMEASFTAQITKHDIEQS
jgi:UDP-3-O-[3-hydroxymyristoyl] N-acetylglucosamine deacetylase/3-hydroxyacyl-[acyl-carrier-protein] dehydratase